MHSVLETPTAAQQGPHSRLLVIGLHVLLWAYVAAAVIASLAAPVSEFDEAIPLVHAALVQQGRTPNLDFASFYPPLSLYVNAMAFHLFGRTVLAPRLVGAVLYLLVIFGVYQLFKTRFPRSETLIPAAVLMVAGSIGFTLSMAVWPGFSIALIALLVYLRYSYPGRNSRLFLALVGFLTGIAILYRVNFGAYVAAVIVCDLLLHWWLDSNDRWGSGLKDALVNLLAYAVPLALFVAVVCVLIYGRSISAGVYEFTVNTQKIMALRGFNYLESYADLTFALLLPLGWFSFRILQGQDRLSAKAIIPITLAFALLGLALAGRTRPSIAVIIAALQLVFIVILQVNVYRLERSEVCLLLFLSCLLHYYLSRADVFHWRILPVVYALLLVFLLFYRSGVSRGTALAVLITVFCILLQAKDFRISASYLRSGVRLLSAAILPPYLPDTGRVLGPTPPNPGWASVYGNPDEIQTLRYVRSITHATDPIFVGVKDHSRVFNNDLRMYWLAGRPIGVKLFQLEPKVATEEKVQRQIVSDLETNGVNCLIIDQEQYLGDETYLSTGYVGSTLLDEYIADHYRQQARFGRFAVLTKAKT
jgi:hypothetical protein